MNQNTPAPNEKRVRNEMVANKADWNKLFAPYPFFEAYKHYLEIDITAANEDDLRKWITSHFSGKIKRMEFVSF